MQVKNIKALPQKIEKRLQDLKDMKEFNDTEIDYCRRTYWNDRAGWHQTLINTYERAKARHAA